MCPAGSTAERSFRESPNTLGRFGAPSAAREALFSSSPTVETSRRRGDAPSPVPPTNVVPGSETLVTLRPSARSYQSLPMMPLIAGVAPDSMVEWPIAVTVG